MPKIKSSRKKPKMKPYRKKSEMKSSRKKPKMKTNDAVNKKKLELKKIIENMDSNEKKALGLEIAKKPKKKIAIFLAIAGVTATTIVANNARLKYKKKQIEREQAERKRRYREENEKKVRDKLIADDKFINPGISNLYEQEKVMSEIIKRATFCKSRNVKVEQLKTLCSSKTGYKNTVNKMLKRKDNTDCIQHAEKKAAACKNYRDNAAKTREKDTRSKYVIRYQKNYK